jgi:hypothetical protein
MLLGKPSGGSAFLSSLQARHNNNHPPHSPHLTSNLGRNRPNFYVSIRILETTHLTANFPLSAAPKPPPTPHSTLHTPHSVYSLFNCRNCGTISVIEITNAIQSANGVAHAIPETPTALFKISMNTTSRLPLRSSDRQSG